MRLHQMFLFTSALAGVAMLAGCGHSRPTPHSGSDSESEGGSAYEHHNPPHKPRDFPSGLADLHQRFSQLFKSSPSKPLAQDKEFAKLVDIVGWLPELAADSDLDRAEWDRVNEQSKQLAHELGRIGVEQAKPQIQQQIDVELQALDDVVRRHPETFKQPSPAQNEPHNQNDQFVDHAKA